MLVDVAAITVEEKRKLLDARTERVGLFIENGPGGADLIITFGKTEPEENQYSARLGPGERLELPGAGVAPVQTVRAAPDGGARTTAHVTEWTS